MTRYLLDIGIASDFINRRKGVFERALAATRRGDRVGTAFIVVAELRAGIELSSSREVNLQRLGHALPSLVLWSFDREAAFRYGEIWADLKQRGKLIPQNDVQIAAIVLSLRNAVLVSKDTDFRSVPGLHIEDWSV